MKKYICREKKKLLPAHIPSSMSPIVYCRPLPSLIAAMSSTYICIIKKKLPFSALQKHGNIFLSQNSHVEHICLVVEPPKEEKSTWTKYYSKKCLLMKKLLSADVWNKKKKVFSVKMTFKKLCGMKFFFALLSSRNLVGRTKMSF